MSKIIDTLNLLRREGYEQLSLSGGEPLLYKEIDKLIQTANEIGYRISLITNGTLISSTNMQIIISVDFVAIRIDGGNDLHNMLRARPNAFKNAVRGLQRLRDNRIQFAIIFAATRKSFEDILTVADLALRIGASALHIRPIVMTGRAARDCSEVELKKPDLDRLLVLTHVIKQQLGSALPIQLDLVSCDAVRSNFCAYGAILNYKSALLSDLINPIVIRHDGIVRPLTYDFDEAFDLGNIESISRNGKKSISNDSVALFCNSMKSIIDEFGDKEGLIDWFAYLTAKFRENASASRNSG